MGVKCLIPLGFSEILAQIQKRHPNCQYTQIFLSGCPLGKETFANWPIRRVNGLSKEEHLVCNL